MFRLGDASFSLYVLWFACVLSFTAMFGSVAASMSLERWGLSANVRLGNGQDKKKGAHNFAPDTAKEDAQSDLPRTLPPLQHGRDRRSFDVMILKGEGKISTVWRQQLEVCAGERPLLWQANAWMDEEIMLAWLQHVL